MKTSLLRGSLAAALLVLPAVAGAAVTAIAHPAGSLHGSEADPLFLPTDVAVDSEGRVWVADGVNDRVVHFGPDGKLAGEIRELGGEALARPVGLATSDDGRLWIADTGHGRVLVRGVDGGLDRVLSLPAELEGRVDLVDLVITDQGQRAWLVDNDGHRLLVVNVADSSVETFGGRGEALGQWDRPFLAGSGKGGDVLVSDVLNGRVQVVTRRLNARGTVGSYGVGPGELYRPKGIAVDEQGRVWVADGDLGVVQVFEPNGGFVDVLRDESGAVLRLDAPVGLAWAGDRLYVVESVLGRVSRFDIELRTSRRLPEAGPALLPGKPKDCTACHLELMPSLAHGVPTLLAEVPPSSPELPAAAREAACLSCHDGSVEDSRRSVWREHGHSADVLPPADMQIPAGIPLVDGRLACRSCHTAHSEGGSGHSCREALFLRVTAGASELCIACHGDMNEQRAVLPRDLQPGGQRADSSPSGHLGE